MRKRLPIIILVVAAVSAVPTAHGLDLGVTFALSNMDFSRERAATATELPGATYLWGLGAVGSQELAEDVYVEFEYRDDPILRRQFYTRLQYTDQFFRIMFGPFFGLWNAPETILQSGLSTTVQLFVPGLVTVSLRSDTSLSARLVVAGDYIQEQSELSVGFFVYNAIPTVYLRNRRYTYKTATGERVDSLTEYGLQTDIFQKNIPYRIVLDFAFHQAKKSFLEATDITHGYGALVLGTEINALFLDTVTFFVDLETSIYTFGTDAIVGTVNSSSFLFRGTTGIRLQL